jgi:hypothetical protein
VNSANSQRRGGFYHLVRGTAVVLAVACVSSLGYAGWKFISWENKMIRWDYATIERLCGGDTPEDRLLDIRFVKQWEYEALKQTSDGKRVWIRWKLSKRHCGNWMLVDPSQSALIRPFKVRFPNGAPPRGGVDCLGGPVNESNIGQQIDFVVYRAGTM